jgi:hypothetical protein
MLALSFQVLPARLAHKESKVNKENKDLQDRLEQLESRVRQDRQALLDLLDRLESVVVSARQFWYHKTTLLKWMIIILALIVMDRLLSHFPQIASLVTKLL